jgi:hypothetical protein
MTTAEAADLTLHPTFLMGSIGARAAKETIESVVAAQCDEPLRLDSVTALKDPYHCGLQIVIFN